MTQDEVVRERPWSSAQWCDHFRANARSLLEIPWTGHPELTRAERRAVRRSLQGFQLGESSEGRHFLACARRHAERAGDTDYVEAVRLFIGEEQRHARELAHFLTQEEIGLIGNAWPDTVFRHLRRLAGLELSIAVLITAEIIALVYYAAVRAATRSRALRSLCDQILRDEVHHVRFQAERLALLRLSRPRWRARLAEEAHRVFFAGTCLVVWWGHGRALRAGGFGFVSFVARAHREFSAACRIMRTTSDVAFLPIPRHEVSYRCD